MAVLKQALRCTTLMLAMASPPIVGVHAADTGPQLAQANSAGKMNGEWIGRYLYGDRNEQVNFFASLRAEGGGFRGWIVEPNTFGATNARYLSANVTGTISPDGQVEFVKTYDGTGGQTHSVRYRGQMGADGAIRGQWTIPPNARGGFTLQPAPR